MLNTLFWSITGVQKGWTCVYAEHFILINYRCSNRLNVCVCWTHYFDQLQVFKKAEHVCMLNTLFWPITGVQIGRTCVYAEHFILTNYRCSKRLNMCLCWTLYFGLLQVFKKAEHVCMLNTLFWPITGVQIGWTCVYAEHIILTNYRCSNRMNMCVCWTHYFGQLQVFKKAEHVCMLNTLFWSITGVQIGWTCVYAEHIILTNYRCSKRLNMCVCWTLYFDQLPDVFK